MTLHIGIVACSSEGAALCYRTICAEGAARLGGHAHPEISMHTPPLSDYVTALGAGDLDRVAGLMLASADKLAANGADFLICPDNTIHAAMARVRPRSPRPWLHIAAVVAEAAEAQGYRRLGLLGTRWLMEGDVYPRVLEERGIEWRIPEADDRAEIDRIIMGELVHGHFHDRSRAWLAQVVERLAGEGCDAVVLGCTELPLIMEAPLSLPVLDSTRLLARAALDRALAGHA